jgi:hypothetical protein
MALSDRLIYVLLGLTVLMIVGMLTSSWRMILYPVILVMGISILFGFLRELPERKRALLVAGSVAGGFALLFVIIDIMTGGEPTGRSTTYVLGMTPPTALYMLGFPLLVVLAGVLYALTFQQEDVQEVLEERAVADEVESEQGGPQ